MKFNHQLPVESSILTLVRHHLKSKTNPGSHNLWACLRINFLSLSEMRNTLQTTWQMPSLVLVDMTASHFLYTGHQKGKIQVYDPNTLCHPVYAYVVRSPSDHRPRRSSSPIVFHRKWLRSSASLWPRADLGRLRPAQGFCQWTQPFRLIVMACWPSSSSVHYDAGSLTMSRKKKAGSLTKYNYQGF